MSQTEENNGRKGRPGSGEGQRLEIRKYPNRRYYDTTRSCHVTLEEINSLIRDGYEVQVTDTRTNEDITAKILAQIILDLDSPKLGVFPVPLLHRLIRANEQLVFDFVDKYFNQALGSFLDSQRTFEQSFRRAMGLSAPGPTVTDWAKMMWGPLAQPFWSGGRSSQPASASGGSGAPEAKSPEPQQPQQPEELRQLVDDLRQQVHSLKQQVERNRKGKPRRK